MAALSTPIARALLLGVGAGVLSGLFGVGGGVVLVPGLVLLCGVAQHRAHATSLAAILPTAAATSASFAVGGAVSYRAGAAIAVGALVGAYAGAALMHRLSEDRLRQIFAVLLLLVAVRLLVGGDVADSAPPASLDLLRLAGLVVLGLAAGVLSALLGVGGGVIMVPALVLAFGFSQHLAEGTSLLVILPTALTGAWRHARRGYTDWRLGLLIGMGGIVGGIAGARVALALPSAGLARLFALFLLVTGARMLLRARRKRPARATDTR
jgi:uncharacterized membrane protein YfcA